MNLNNKVKIMSNVSMKGIISDIVVNEGTTKKGEQWKAAEFTVTEDLPQDQYPNAVRMKQFGMGEKIKYVDGFLNNNNAGDLVEVEYSSKVRDYTNQNTGKTSYFQENSVFKVNSLSQAAGAGVYDHIEDADVPF